MLIVMIKKDWDGYREKIWNKIWNFLKNYVVRRKKHHFLQDSVHISKFCAAYQIVRKIPRAQNHRILEGMDITDQIYRQLLPSSS